MKPDLLLEMPGKFFHILPGRDGVSQEENMASIKSGGLLYAKYLYQKDGSRLKCIYSRKFEAMDIIARMEIMFPHRPKIIVQDKMSAEEIVSWLERKMADWSISTVEYRAYWMHTFLNGKRYVPVLIDTALGRFVDASCLFPEDVPEDGLGVLVKDVEDVSIHIGKGGIAAVEMDYRSFTRLCPCCGVVSNVKKPRKNPWLPTNQKFTE